MGLTKRARRIKTTEEQWRDIFSAWSSSGLSEEEFCQRENYSIEAFRYQWKELKMPNRKKPSTQTRRTKFQTRSDAAKQRWVRDEKKEAFWRQHIGVWKRSGLSKRAYCKSKNLADSSFNAWYREIELRDREKVATTNAAVLLTEAEQKSTNPFVPLRLVASEPQQEQLEPPHTKADETQQTISILVPGGAVLRVTDNCNLNFVAELYSSLKI